MILLKKERMIWIGCSQYKEAGAKFGCTSVTASKRRAEPHVRASSLFRNFSRTELLPLSKMVILLFIFTASKVASFVSSFGNLIFFPSVLLRTYLLS